MTTVPNDGADYSPSSWISFATSMFQAAPQTWHCASWVPFVRYVLTIYVIVIAVVGVAAGLGHFLPGLAP